MQQLVLQYSAGDGFTYWCTNTHPFMYESAEKALVDFETLLHANISAWKGGQSDEFMFAGIKLGMCNFLDFDDTSIVLPDIWTIDEWFVNECKNLV